MAFLFVATALNRPFTPKAGQPVCTHGVFVQDVSGRRNWTSFHTSEFDAMACAYAMTQFSKWLGSSASGQVVPAPLVQTNSGMADPHSGSEELLKQLSEKTLRLTGLTEELKTELAKQLRALPWFRPPLDDVE
ncbi:MAG: hypothetical protein K1X67_17485 [Fimbriimonadaceae bacterium]|nr:hypothetical protein [Fimbriimonadaceae bacterium]